MTGRPWTQGRKFWDDEKLADKAIEWYEQYGEWPKYSDWDKTALHRQAEAASDVAKKLWERYARYQDGDWPSKMTVFRVFRGRGGFGRMLEIAKAKRDGS